MITNCLAACTHLSSTVSQLFEPQVQKNRRFHVPQPTFFVSPGDAPAIMTQYVASMERQFNVCHPLVECAYLTITVSEILVENGLLLGNYTDKKY